MFLTELSAGTIAAAAHSVFERPNCPAAEQRLKEITAHCAKSAPKLVAWLEEKPPRGFTVFTLPAAHRERMRTSNALERIKQELKRRTCVTCVFPNAPSLRPFDVAKNPKKSCNAASKADTQNELTPTQTQFPDPRSTQVDSYQFGRKLKSFQPTYGNQIIPQPRNCIFG